MHGKFYAEAYSIDLNRADRIGAFMNSFQSLPLLKEFENEDFDEAWEPEE